VLGAGSQEKSDCTRRDSIGIRGRDGSPFRIQVNNSLMMKLTNPVTPTLAAHRPTNHSHRTRAEVFA
jgi:hypothetical protein